MALEKSTSGGARALQELNRFQIEGELINFHSDKYSFYAGRNNEIFWLCKNVNGKEKNLTVFVIEAGKSEPKKYQVSSTSKLYRLHFRDPNDKKSVWH